MANAGGSTLLKGETPLSRVERPGNREMGFESPRCSGSSKDALVTPRRHGLADNEDNRGECRKDYIDPNRQVAGSNPAGPNI